MANPVTATLTKTEADDTVVAGVLRSLGQLSLSEAVDTAAATGTALVAGGLVATEAADEPSSFGHVSIAVIPDQQINSSFSVQGSFFAVPSLTYSDDGGSSMAFPPGSSEPSTPIESWALTHAGFPAGAHTITVTETVTGATTTASVVVTTLPDVVGTLGLTEGADTLVANALPAAVATVVVTEADDVLHATSGARSVGTLTATEAADTVVAKATLGSGGLAVTEAPDTLSAAGDVPVLGSLTVVELPDGYFPPQVPTRQRGAPIGYRQGVLPVLQGGAEAFAQRQFSQIRATIDDLLLLTPQSATKAPSQLRDGMQRLARNPWRPVPGQAADAWVYWDGAAQQWRFVGDTPNNT